MTDEQKYEQIESFIKGELSTEEVAKLEKKIQDDQIFAKEVAIQKDLYEAVKDAEVLAFRAKLNQYRGDTNVQKNTGVSSNKPAKRISLRRTLAIAASILLLAVVGLVIYLNQDTSSPESLYATYMEYPNELSVRVRGNETPTQTEDTIQQINAIWEEVDGHYQNQAFNDALETLQAIPIIDPDFSKQPKSAYYYHLGLILSKLERPQEALDAFSQVSTNYVEDAQWRSALILLTIEGRQDEAINNLQSIATSNHPKKEDAEAILRALN